MWLIKIYNAETQQKCLLPVTSWCYHFSSASQYYCIPLPADKQPLYNLDLLFKPETETIVLTDSVEIADSCQRNAPKNTVFTSFLCEPGHYEQVDWLPLDGKKIHYLITNHSGISLDGATLKAKELSDFLTSDESGLNHGIELDFFILRFQYNSESPIRFRTVDDILEQYSRHTEINSKEFRYLEGDNEFKALCTDAENHIKNVNLRWWQESGHATEEIRLVEEKQNKKAPINYLLHPLLVKGESTMLYAKPKLGKSALAYSIAAVIVARGFSERPTSLLQEKCWYVANGKHKVLYLEFENTSQIDTRQKDFQYAYFSKEKQKECLANLIVKDMSSRSLDYSAPQNHQVILDMIEAAKKEGTSDLAVELVVIDTYTAFVRSENPQTTANFKEMLNKIRNMGIAVLIVHHANSSNIARGLSDKLDQLAFKFRLSRENNELDNLEAPITVTYEETRCDMNAKMKLPFEIFYSKEDHRWHLKADESEAENLKRFKELYENSGYSEYDICQMSGLKKSTYHERLKGKK